MTGWGWRLGKDLERRDTEVYFHSTYTRGREQPDPWGSHTTASPLLRKESRDSKGLTCTVFLGLPSGYSKNKQKTK